MAAKVMKDAEKVAVGAIRTAIQTWLAPQLSGISERLTHVEARLDSVDRRFEAVEKRLEEGFTSLRSELGAHIDAVRTDIRRLDNVADLRERMASLEAKLAHQG